MPTRVLLADDHLLFAQALGKLLAQRYDLIDVVADGKALYASARTNKPDVIVTDITMPHMSGLDSIRLLRKDSVSSKIVFLTIHANAEIARECFSSGGSAFVTKHSGFDELVVAIDAVISNRQYVSPDVAADLIELSQEPAALADELSVRQREILQLFAEGRTMKEIATITNLSTRTVEWHKYRMMKLFNIRRSAELVQHAVRMRLVN
jgi:DNA-binding NarL/FixJ family response regulator